MATADPLLADSLLMAAPKLPQPELIRCMMARPKRGRQAAGAGQDAQFLAATGVYFWSPSVLWVKTCPGPPKARRVAEAEATEQAGTEEEELLLGCI